MNDPSAHARLSADLEAAALRALAVTHGDLNSAFFRGALRTPTFVLTDTRTRLGRWVGALGTLEISRAVLLEHGWGGVVEVLKHEMAHQYVDEVLQVRDEAAHGPMFQRVCAERGFDARATGAPTPGAETNDPQARVLERVAKLLALAQSPNLHEAQSAMNAAQRLMLKHNLEVLQSPHARGYTFRHLGEPSGRVDEAQRVLANILNDHFFVDTIWVPVWRVREGRRGHVLEVCGTRENVEMAEYVHSFLRHTAEGLWRGHKRTHGIAGDRDRRAYIAGVMAGFRDQLAAQRTEDQARGLVWVGDADLSRYFRQRHPRVRTIHRSSSANEAAHAHGREAGRKIVLHRGVTGAAPAGPRQLGPGGR
jgi:hypothetical protein